jgi:hypothetical protein
METALRPNIPTTNPPSISGDQPTNQELGTRTENCTRTHDHARADESLLSDALQPLIAPSDRTLNPIQVSSFIILIITM